MYAFLSDEQNAGITKVIATYVGDPTPLTSALGCLVMGNAYGWRYLSMVHSPPTVKKYEDILGLSFSEILPEYTDLSNRNVGIRYMRFFGTGYWSMVLGHSKLENRRDLTD